MTDGPRWLWLHEYRCGYKGTLSLALPAHDIRKFGVRDDGLTWIETEKELHVVTESFEDIYTAVTSPEWTSPALTQPPEKED